jgi:hypothetical protein
MGWGVIDETVVQACKSTSRAGVCKRHVRTLLLVVQHVHGLPDGCCVGRQEETNVTSHFTLQTNLISGDYV